MRKRRQVELFSLSFLDLISGALGAVIILYVAIPKKNMRDLPQPTAIENEVVRQELAQSRQEVQQLREQIAKLTLEPTKEEPIPVKATTAGQSDIDVGFRFKGKEILFLIDTSYSMTDEDRMGQVKAGLKMLLTSMPPTYKIDIVRFPLGERSPFKTMWGVTRETDTGNKQDAFDFIYSLYPDGGTPTRDTLLFALKNYDSISDIVILTDGAPTFHNSNKKDDIYDILRVVREHNPRKVQINCIGVGSEFVKDKSSERYKFLSLLSQEHNGFFVGF